jgi:nucleoside-diphosphate-sugar epimerase
MQRRVPDITRIYDLIDWRPRRSLDEILQAVIEFERKKIGLTE